VASERPRRGSRDLALLALRVGFPAAIVLGGALVAVLGRSEASAGAAVVIIGIGVLTAIMSAMFQLALQSEDEREQEERAREHFSRHGRWPDEPEV
jgi:ABC-type transport system involved in cytochrome bd biosynthesis fused ATPase/permease subunit